MRSFLYPVVLLLAFLLPGVSFGQPTFSTEEVAADITATILGSETEVCSGDSVAAYIFFTGDGPWDAVINDNSGEYAVLTDVETPYTIWLKPETDDRYYVASVNDRRGRKGKTYGEVYITVYPTSSVTILLDRTAYLQNEPGVTLHSTPSGAVFSGNGVIQNVFYPSIATPVGSPHRITCEYANPNGCISSDRVNLYVLYGIGEVFLTSGNDTINALCDDGSTYVIRGSNLDDIPGIFELIEAGSGDPVPGHITDDNLQDDRAILDPAGLTGPYDIAYTYETRGLSVTHTRRITVNDLGPINIPGLPDAVCKNDDPYPLVPELEEDDPGATYLFSGPGVSGDQSDGFFYNPGDPDAPVGENQIELKYTSSNGCSVTLFREVTNRFVPDLQFTLEPACLSDDGSIVSFENLTEDKEHVESWSWDFGDPSSGENNYSDEENPAHFYSEAGPRHITLSAVTTNGCMASLSVDTVLSDQPVADFSWLSDCYEEGEAVRFINSSVSTHAPLDSLIWTFMTEGGDVLDVIGSGSPDDTVEYMFTGADHYLVGLQIHNQVGCGDENEQEIILSPIRVLSADGYVEDFDGTVTDWFEDSEDQHMSWMRSEPDFAGYAQVPGDLAWFTDLPSHQSGYLEHSWIQSACLDFRDLNSPFIQIDLMKSFKPDMDGAVLQYQNVVSEGWKTIGTLGAGINWYNVSSLYNEPGGSTFGWGLDNTFIPDTEWQHASHDLNELAGLPHVKLRIAVATGGEEEMAPGQYNQGFAFDNIVIGESVRRSLLEHFTNSSSVECREADDLVDLLVQNHWGNVIDLQYHMEYPGVDLMNANNPYPPSARAFTFGVQGVPFAVLNGGATSDQQFDFSGPSQEPTGEILKQASLEVPVFDLDLTVNWLANRLEVSSLVTCKVDTFQSNLQLYLAVIETYVTAYPGLNGDSVFRNVVLDILPNATGKLLGNEWYKGKTDSRTYSWDYAAYVEDIEELAVVGFIQDRDRRPVMQVAANYHSHLVGESAEQQESRALSIYPNPAVNRVYVNLGKRPADPGQLQVMDLSGKVVMLVDIEPGYSLYQLDVGSVVRGMYMIHWIESGEVKSRSKLVLTR